MSWGNSIDFPRNMVGKGIICMLYLFLVPVLFLNTGCSILKPPPSEAAQFWTPPKWEKTTKAPDEIWMSLRARKADASKPLKLGEFVNIALRNNPEILQAYYAARAAHARLKQAESEWYPQITTSGNFTKDKKMADPKSDNKNTRSYGVTANADILALDFGGRAAAVKEAYHDLIAANFDFNQAIQDVILQTENAYFALYTAKANLEAAEANAVDGKTTLYVTEQKFDAGLAVKLDVLQIKANYDETLFALEEAKGEVKNAEADLAVALGFPADTMFGIADPSWKIPEDMTKQDVRELIEEGMRNRQDIASSRATLRSKKAAVTVANSKLWPTLNAGGTATKNWTETFGDDESYKHYHEYTGFLQVNWDVFNGFNDYAGRIEAEAEREGARTQLLQDELAASADVWTKYYELKTAISKLKYGEAFLESASSSFDMAVESYRAGLKSVTDLIQAQTQLAQARSNLVQAKDDKYKAFIGLLHATGSLSPESISE